MTLLLALWTTAVLQQEAREHRHLVLPPPVLGLDVFDADDDVFDDEEVDDYAVPVERIVAPVEQEWGVGTFLSLLTGTGLMIVCGMVLFELVKSIWSAEDPGFTGTLIDSVGGMFN